MKYGSAIVAALVLALLAGCPKKEAASTASGKAGGKSDARRQSGPKSKETLFREAMEEGDAKARAKLLESLLAQLENPAERQAVSRVLAQAYAEAGQVEKLEPLYSEADDPAERQVAGHLLLQAYAEAGELEKMEGLYSELSIGDDFRGAQARNAMAYAYAEKGEQLDRARALIMQALSLIDQIEAGSAGVGRDVDIEDERFKAEVEETRAYFLDTLGWIDFKAGKIREAIAVLEEADRRVDHSTVRFHLGEAYRVAGEFDKAATAYARAAVLDDDDAAKARVALEKLAKEKSVDAKKALNEAEAEKKARDEEKKAREDAERAREEARMSEHRDSALAHRAEHEVPSFAIEDFDGNVLDNAALEDKVTVIDFWATWCGPCKYELPIYQKVFEKYRDRVNFLAVSVDQTREEAEEYIADEDFSFPVAHDPPHPGTVQRTFRVTGLPTIFVVGPCGRINWVHQGFRQDIESVLTAQIETLLSETDQSCEETDAPRSRDL